LKIDEGTAVFNLLPIRNPKSAFRNR